MLADFQNFQESFKGEWLERTIQEHDEIPMFFVVGYLLIVFYLPEKLKNREPMKLRPLFMFWNFALTLFSFIGAYYTVPLLASRLLSDGFQYTICTSPENNYYHDGACGLWVGLFILSKIPELTDTLFLVVQKKPVIFLHWFHHVTVMLYCWHSYVHRIGSGLWFATMNYCVHSVMYLYYFLMCFSAARKMVRPFAVYITSLQILQMIVGMGVTVSAFMMYDRANPENCAQDPANMRMGLLMYTSYFILFGSLFKKLYLSKDSAKNPVRSPIGRSRASTAAPGSIAATIVPGSSKCVQDGPSVECVREEMEDICTASEQATSSVIGSKDE